MIRKDIQTTDRIPATEVKGSNVDSLLGYVFKLWCRGKKQILDEFGLTIPQFEVLSAIVHLSSRKKEIIQSDLSKEARIVPMNVSTILRNLEKNKLITRTRGTVDTRVIHVVLTEKGKSLHEQAALRMASSYSKLYSNIDEKNLTIQLIRLSNELNKPNN